MLVGELGFPPSAASQRRGRHEGLGGRHGGEGRWRGGDKAESRHAMRNSRPYRGYWPSSFIARRHRLGGPGMGFDDMVLVRSTTL